MAFLASGQRLERIELWDGVERRKNSNMIQKLLRVFGFMRKLPGTKLDRDKAGEKPRDAKWERCDDHPNWPEEPR